MALQLEFRHDCQNLGCANLNCNLCKLSQRRRCLTNFAAKYLAPCDVVEAKCGAQIYVVVVDTATGQLVQQGLEELALLISIVDGRKFDAEGASEETLEHCELLTNKQGQPLLAHGRSGSYTDTKRVLVPMIHGQALLPDLKITDSSEALLTGRAPPFRLAVRAVHRNGEPFEGVHYALSDPFVVATARVKGAAKLEIPHVDDHVSKIDCVGLQTQKKLEDIKAAAVAAGVPDLNLAVNCVTKVGQFRDLVETAERNKSLRETLKQVLRLTKGWDVARDHVRKAVETDLQLRVYHPDGRTEVGLVFKCGSFNVIDINRPVGLMRRKQNPTQANQELVDVIWLPLDTASFPDAVKRMLPQASADWRKDAHPGWALLPLTTSHMPPYSEGGKPTSQTSSFTFTIRNLAPPPPAPTPPAITPTSSAAISAGVPGRSSRDVSAAAAAAGMQPHMMTSGSGASTGGGMNGFMGAPSAPTGGSGGLLGLNLTGGALGGLGMPPQLPTSFLGSGGGGGGLNDTLRMQQAGLPGLSGLQGQLPQPGGLPPDLLFGSQQQQQQQAAAQQQRQQQLNPYGGLGGLPLGGDLQGALAGLDAATMQGLMQMPTLDLFSSAGAPGTAGPLSGASTSASAQRAAMQQQQAAAAAAAAAEQQRAAAHQQQLAGLPPELAHLLKEDSLSPFEDPNFQQLMSMVAANAPGSGPQQQQQQQQRGPAPTSGGRLGREGNKQAKRKADTSLETWMDMHKSLDVDLGSLPNNNNNMGQVAPLESLFTSMLPGGGDLGGSSGDGGPPPPPVGFFPALPSGGGGRGGGGPPDQEDIMQEQPSAGMGGPAGPAPSTQTQQRSEAQPMDVQQQPSEAASQQQVRQGQDVGFTSAPSVTQQAAVPGPAAAQEVQQPAAAAAAMPGGGAAPPPAVPTPPPAGVVAPAPQPLVTNVTLEQMQQQFARAMRQEITFAELEIFLKQYNLLPSGQPAPAAAAPGQQQPGAAGAAQGKDGSGGLDDMQSIEVALPAFAAGGRSG